MADVPLFRRQTTNKWSSPPLNIQLPNVPTSALCVTTTLLGKPILGQIQLQKFNVQIYSYMNINTNTIRLHVIPTIFFKPVFCAIVIEKSRERRERRACNFFG